jgi:membrane fusion protein (multidrug efflux system)
VRYATIGLLSFMALLAGCKPSGPQGHGGFPPAIVSVEEVKPATVPVRYEYVGQTAGARQIEVRARVSGILMQRHYKEGSVVGQGQSLFLIDPAPFQAALAQAEAGIASAQAQVDQARRNLARAKPLFEARAISQRELDDATSAEQIAAAALKLADAQAQTARLNLGYTRVEAPIKGIAGRAVPSEGALISGPDVLLTTVTQTDPMQALFGIAEGDQTRLREDIDAGRVKLKNGKFEVDLLSSDGAVIATNGVLDFTDVRVSTQTGTSEARAEVPNPKGVLHPGQFVRVRLNGAERPNAIRVPARAVLENPQGKFVYVLGAENKAEARPVKVGDWVVTADGKSDQWIVLEGLKAGDKVIVDGVMRIGPGAPVQVAPAQGAAPAAPATASNASSSK